MTYIQGVPLIVPVVSVYGANGALAKRVSYSRQMDTATGLVAVVEGMLAGKPTATTATATAPATAKKWWEFWK